MSRESESRNQLQVKLEEVLNFFQADLEHSHMNRECRKFLEKYGHELLAAILPSARSETASNTKQLLRDIQSNAACGEPDWDGIEQRIRAELENLQDAIPVSLLRQHWLHAIECDHEKKTDMPICACSTVHLGWHPSVGAAVEAWIAHLKLEENRHTGAG